MLTTEELTKIAAARLEDGNVLLLNSRYDGAIYICGYALEIALKSRIVKTLAWHKFPENGKEFKELQAIKSNDLKLKEDFMTHDLDTLLKNSGCERKIKSVFPEVWSDVKKWNPESRYKVPGNASPEAAKSMIEKVTKLVAEILP